MRVRDEGCTLPRLDAMSSASDADTAAAAEFQQLVQAIQDTRVANICTGKF